ncbi:MAG: hypothetical protein IJ578_09420 [Bacteroidales bacterium]|nr:hypothetical protein [Bacteroidales bacterium]
MKSYSAILLTVCLLTVSCSIREERAGCPCRLEANLDRFARHARQVSIAVWDGPQTWQETVPAKGTYTREVTKGILFLSAWSGQRAGRLSGSQLSMPPRAEPDSLQVYTARLDCQNEVTRVETLPHKQFCHVTLRVVRDPDVPYPYQFYVESGCCGIDLRDLSPVAGEHIFPVRETGDGVFGFNLLRHSPGADIALAIYDQTKRADALPIGDWMREIGYDWLAEDLADVTFDVDYARQRVRISLADWGPGAVVEREY